MPKHGKLKEESLKNLLFLLSRFIFTSFFILSCSSTKPPIPSIPERDLNGIIYFHSGDGVKVISPCAYSINLDNSEQKELFSSNLIKDLFGVGNSPSISPFGRYLTVQDHKVIDFKFGRKISCGVFDVNQNKFVLELESKLPPLEYNDEPYFIPWSVKDEGFFIIESDTLKKSYPDGSSLSLGCFPDLHDFSVSPSENNVLLYLDDKVSLYKLGLDSMIDIIHVGKTMGISLKYIRGMSWSLDEEKVAFAEGWRLFLYDIPKNHLIEFKAKNKVFAIEWLPGDELLYVEGNCPSDYSTMQFTQYYKIRRLNIKAKSSEIIYQRDNHNPFFIKPKLSPSEKLILFSEKKLNGPYQVKVMTLDGKNINVVAEGLFPVWGK